MRQHAGNPVDWYEWGPEALERARAEDRPILLSIGYSACHWCHVMERESFEDPATAELMNRNFVCIKVDREERPDLDGIYMDAVQAMTGQGGWPMTVFLTPRGEPFFAGTYFPPVDRSGLPGFPRVLEALAAAWREERTRVIGEGTRLAAALTGLAGSSADEPLTPQLLEGAFDQLQRALDVEWGGFGRAPKFPPPMLLEFLLRMHRQGKPEALAMVTVTLDRMAAGGIRDHLGGGFHRYSTDRLWLVPHFEKMLYDNAQLALIYLQAYQLTGQAGYRAVTESTLDHLLRDLRHPAGGFFSAQDADSEGEEGRFFAWDYDEVVGAVGDQGELVAAWFGAVPEGNWEGRNVLWTPSTAAEFAGQHGVIPAELEAAISRAIPLLWELREDRIHPATDDKVVAVWNGLAITALARAGRALDRPDYLEAAVAAARFVLGEMRAPSGGLARAWREGRAGGEAFLDDHAAMGRACLDLYQATFIDRWLDECRSLARTMIEGFADDDGGFFQTRAGGEDLIVRPRDRHDQAVPSGTSLAAELLIRLGRLDGDAELEERGAGALRSMGVTMARAPLAAGLALATTEMYLAPSREVALVGDEKDILPLAKVLWTRYLPHTVLAGGDPRLRTSVPLLAGRDTGPMPSAHVCANHVCHLPVTTPEALAELLAT